MAIWEVFSVQSIMATLDVDMYLSFLILHQLFPPSYSYQTALHTTLIP